MQSVSRKIRVMKVAVLVVLSLAQLSIQTSQIKRDTLFGFPLGRPHNSRPFSPYAEDRDNFAPNAYTQDGLVPTSDYETTGYGNDYSQFVTKQQRAKPINFHEYSTVQQIDNYLDQMAEKYPEICDVKIIGHSVEGRPIRAIRIHPRVLKRPTKPKILVDAGIHAREWIAPAVALYMIQQLVENNDQFSNLTEKLEWHIIPLLNPDGYAYSMTTDRMWRKNRSNTTNPLCLGVDLNRNFDLFFGGAGTSQDPCDETYTGTGPFSEPETRALRDYAKTLNNSRLYLTLHSYGQFFLYPWGFGDALPRDWRDLDNLGRVAQNAIQKVHGTRYRVGSSTNLLGAAAGGSDDWMKGRAGIKYSYTVELPGGGEVGFDLPAKKILGVVQETWEAMKTMAGFIIHEKRRRNK